MASLRQNRSLLLKETRVSKFHARYLQIIIIKSMYLFDTLKHSALRVVTASAVQWFSNGSKSRFKCQNKK